MAFPDQPGRGRKGRQRGQSFFDGAEAANAATRLAGQRALALRKACGIFPVKSDIDADSARAVANVDAGNVIGASDDALRKREPDGEIFEIRGRQHHHGVRRAIELDRNGDLVGKFAARGDDFAFPHHARDVMRMRNATFA